MKKIVALFAVAIIATAGFTPAIAAKKTLRLKGEDAFQCAIRIGVKNGTVKILSKNKYDVKREDTIDKLMIKCK